MVKSIVNSVLGIALALIGSTANAQPVKLKFAFEFSDRTPFFIQVVKSMADAMNASNEVNIELYSGGVLGKGPQRQAQMLLDGTADLSFVLTQAIPSFSDNAAMELPGLYSSLSEVSLVYTRLVAAGALRGFDDFYPIGLFASEPKSIHARRPIASLDDLKGLKIRSSGPLEAAAFAKLGIEPVIMPVPAVAEAISAGRIDGAAVPISVLPELGIGRVTSHHYMLPASADTIAILMSRKTFDRLPPNAQAVIRRHSSESAAVPYNATYEKINEDIIDQLKSDARRKVVTPTPSDLNRAQSVFSSVVSDWAAKDPRHQELLRLVKAEIAKYRATR